ncbi:MAG: DUF4882 domain-containing protein [Acinetobacter sp.]|jgi:hypothetical protein|uniref:DUF4882 family protein n=1 Tax=Acinetobacter TaxID=469 RepID=UPI00283C6F8A|nr:DUF4882 family protein [Acinetobacter sp.]MDR3027254.1 DUF4882 domain-containing protein [Acinetobacter sp.]
MKKLTIAILTGLMSASGWSACTYNFDATNSQISNLGAVPFTNNSGQIVSANVTSDKKMYLTSSAEGLNGYLTNSGTGDKTLPSSGILAFEVAIPKFILSKPSNGEVEADIILFSKDSVNQGVLSGMIYLHSGYNNVSGYSENARVGGFLGGGSYTMNNGQMTINNPSVSLPFTGATLPLNSNYRVGIYLNQNSKQLGLIINGVNKGYVFNYEKSLLNLGVILGLTTARLTPSDNVLNQEVKLSLVTDKNEFQFTYPTGTKDICGNTI